MRGFGIAARCEQHDRSWPFAVDLSQRFQRVATGRIDIDEDHVGLMQGHAGQQVGLRIETHDDHVAFGDQRLFHHRESGLIVIDQHHPQAAVRVFHRAGLVTADGSPCRDLQGACC